MICPSSSTITETVSPSYPAWVTTTSTTSDEPVSTVLGGSARLTWMSRSKLSSPTATVYTGIPCACRGMSASANSSPELSAPSVTTTRPESGTEASSDRARSSAGPRRVRLPVKLISEASSIRSVRDEKRKKRTAKRSERAVRTGESGAPKVSCRKEPRDRPSKSWISMLRESSSSTPTKFCCGTTVETTRAGRSRQNASTASPANRRPPSTSRSNGGSCRARPCR